MKSRKTYLTILLLLCLAGTAAGQWLQPTPGRKRAVYGVGYYVSPSSYDYSTLARSIVGSATTDYEKAQRIYLWLCDNITFDRSGQIRSADETYQRRTAVCQGYCELFYRLGECVGVKPRLIYGKCRLPAVHGRPSTMQDHVWLSVSTAHGDILMDPTWGAGFYRGERFVRQSDPLKWFDVAPAWFVFTHFPDNSRRQHLSPAVTAEQFGRLPFVTPPSHSDVASDGHDALAGALAELRLPQVLPAKVDSVQAEALPADSLQSE